MLDGTLRLPDRDGGLADVKIRGKDALARTVRRPGPLDISHSIVWNFRRAQRIELPHGRDVVVQVLRRLARLAENPALGY